MAPSKTNPDHHKTHLHRSALHLSPTAPTTSAYLSFRLRTLHPSLPEKSSSRTQKLTPQRGQSSKSEAPSCAACGAVFIPGWTCAVRIERKPIHISENASAATGDKRKRKSKRRRAAWDLRRAPAAGGDEEAAPQDARGGGEGVRTDQPLEVRKFVVYTCERCGRGTRIPLSDQEGAGRRRRGGTRALKGVSGENGAVQVHDGPSQAQRRTARDTAGTANQEDRGSVNAASKRRARERRHGGLRGMLEKGKVGAAGGRGEGGDGGGLDLMDFMKSL